MITRNHLAAFLEVVDQGSILAASNRYERSRATYHRYFADIRRFFDAPELFQRAPGQRQGVLTPAGRTFAARCEAFLMHWDAWAADTRDALARPGRAVRIGALAGSFDLLVELVAQQPSPFEPGTFTLAEYPSDRLQLAVTTGAVDLGFGTEAGAELERNLAFEELGPLSWSVIIPKAMAARFPEPIHIRDLHEVPMVVHRAGLARTTLQRCFSRHPEGPFTLRAAVEVESTPRMVEMVARGFGPAVVSRFRATLRGPDVLARHLVDGPAAIVAGVYTRKSAPLPPAALQLVRLAKARFLDVVRDA